MTGPGRAQLISIYIYIYYDTNWIEKYSNLMATAGAVSAIAAWAALALAIVLSYLHDHGLGVAATQLYIYPIRKKIYIYFFDCFPLTIH